MLSEREKSRSEQKLMNEKSQIHEKSTNGEKLNEGKIYTKAPHGLAPCAAVPHD
jgi:hypothetical protein